MASDILQFATAIGTVAATVGIMYTFMRNLKEEFKNEMNIIHGRIDQQENRIFQLAMGKSLKDIIIEEKQKEEKVKAKSK